jgi:hypothetical protein
VILRCSIDHLKGNPVDLGRDVMGELGPDLDEMLNCAAEAREKFPQQTVRFLAVSGPVFEQTPWGATFLEVLCIACSPSLPYVLAAMYCV